MSFTKANHAELEVLMLFDPKNHLEGIKIHHTASQERIAAAKSLYDKGFITQEDGGYLTHLGIEAVELAQSLHTMLNAHSDEHGRIGEA